MSESNAKKVTYDINDNVGKTFMILSGHDSMDVISDRLEHNNFTRASDFKTFSQYSLFERAMSRMEELHEEGKAGIHYPDIIICHQNMFEFDTDYIDGVDLNEIMNNSNDMADFTNRCWITLIKKYNDLFNQDIRFVFFSPDGGNTKDAFLRELVAHNVKDIFNIEKDISVSDVIAQLTLPPNYENIKPYAVRDRSAKYNDIEYVPLHDTVDEDETSEKKSSGFLGKFKGTNKKDSDTTSTADVVASEDVEDSEPTGTHYNFDEDAEIDPLDEEEEVSEIQRDKKSKLGLKRFEKLLMIIGLGLVIMVVVGMIVMAMLSGEEEQVTETPVESETASEGTVSDDSTAESDPSPDSDTESTLEDEGTSSNSGSSGSGSVNPLTAIYRDHMVGEHDRAVQALNAYGIENIKKLDTSDVNAIAFIYGVQGDYDKAIELSTEVVEPIRQHITNTSEDSEVLTNLEALQSRVADDDKLNLQVAGYNDDFDTVLELYNGVDVTEEDTDIQNFIITALVSNDKVADAETFLENYENEEAQSIITEYNSNEKQVKKLNAEIRELKSDMDEADNIKDKDERDKELRSIKGTITNKQNELRDIIVVD